MHEVTFRVDGSGALADVTRDAECRVELWCNDHCDLLSVTGGDHDRLLAYVEDLVGVRESVRSGGELVVITEDCIEPHESTLVETHLAEHGCLALPPLRYEDGAKSCRALSLDPANLTAAYRDLVAEANVTVESKREIGDVPEHAPLLTVPDVLSRLTDRQTEVLGVAYEQGYYRIPRDVTTADVAAEFGVDRRTAEEHIRRAENKLVDSVAEYLPVRR